jgi:CSLREA domain-containing protein
MTIGVRSPRVILLVLALAFSLVLAAEGGTAFAAEFTVNSTADTTECASTCTLRGAIAAADASAEPSNTIVLPAGVFTFGPAKESDPTGTGELRISNPSGTTLTIKGAGVASTMIDQGLHGNKESDRVMRVSGGGTDILEGLTIEKGFQHEDEAFSAENVKGAGILQVGGELKLEDVHVTDDKNNGWGGGIDVEGNGKLTIDNSEIGHDSTSSGGGGVNLEPGTMVATNSTFDNDTAAAGQGGGVQVWTGSSASFTNDTIAEDGFEETGLTYEGGGLFIEGLGPVSMTNVTFAKDIAGGAFGGGSDISTNEGSHLELTNVLLGPRLEEEAGQQDCTNGTLPDDAKGIWVDLGGNLSADESCELNAADMGRELKLGELGMHGGLTPTVPLLEGSPAIDFGVSGCPTTDQRGYARVGGCDSGAFQFDGVAPKIGEGGSPSGSSGSQAGTSGTAGTTTSSTTTTTASTTSGVASTPKAIEELRLGCTNTQLVLNDVYIQGSRVEVRGSAAKSYVGKRVKILFNEGKSVATATVEANGQFTTTAPLPPAKVRDNLDTRYTAEIGKLRSVHLKLVRRLLLEPLKASGTTVTLTGQLTPPLTKPISPVTVEQQLECGKTTVVKTFTPSASGRFDITLTVPSNAKAAIFRLTSKVAANKHSITHGFTTFSLPLPVALG